MIITTHAIEQAQCRVYEYRNQNEKSVRSSLQKRFTQSCLKHGEKRPGNAWEVCVNGVSLIIRYSIPDSDWIALTCLGDKQYRHWFRGEKKKHYDSKVYA